MSIRSVRLERPSLLVNYGFTLRHVAIPPPFEDTETSPVRMALVARVERGSPAERGGVRVGDRVLAVNSLAVSNRSYAEIVHQITTSERELGLMLVSDLTRTAASSPARYSPRDPLCTSTSSISSHGAILDGWRTHVGDRVSCNSTNGLRSTPGGLRNETTESHLENHRHADQVKRYGGGDWEERLKELAVEEDKKDPVPFRNRYSTRQASFMAAVSGRDHANLDLAISTSSHPGSNTKWNQMENVDRAAPSISLLALGNDARSSNGLCKTTSSSVSILPNRLRPSSSSMMAERLVPGPDTSLPSGRVQTASMIPAESAGNARRSGAPHPPATQRIHKFITLFSSSNENNNQVRLHAAHVQCLQLAKTAVVKTSERSASEKTAKAPRRAAQRVTRGSSVPPTIPVRTSTVRHQGQLIHQQVGFGNGRRCETMQCWGLLHRHTLFLCRQLSSYMSGDLHEKMLNIPGDSVQLDVREALVDIAYELQAENRPHVFRLITQRHTEHLLQATSEREMLAWIEQLQLAARSLDDELDHPVRTSDLHRLCSTTKEKRNGDDERVAGTTSELIMQRYKAKSGAILDAVSRTNDADASIACNGQYDDTPIPAGTPKSARKWKRAKATKQESAVSDTGAPSGLGHRISECATSGEDGDLVPLLVQLCVRVVEAHGMEAVGIYRIPGNTAAVNSLKENLKLGFDKMDFADPRWKDVNVVSSLLKMFLRQLPEPLLTDKLYPFFIDASRVLVHTQRLNKLRHLLRKLPRSHYATLKYLVGHLRCVVALSNINKMETRNLALMFGPSIVRPSDDNMATMVTHMSDQCRIVETLINYYEWFFDETDVDSAPPPEMKAVIGGATISSISTGLEQAASPTSSMASSFNDVHHLLRHVNTDESANEKSRMRSILNVRRNSKKEKWRASPSTPQVAGASVSGTRASSSSASASVDEAFSGVYQERNIDAEIANRGAATSTAGNERVEGASVESFAAGSENADEMRKRRQQNIYSARRIFIAGSGPDTTHHADLDDLAGHTRHLNATAANQPALAVLSPETREMIRRLREQQSLSTYKRLSTTGMRASIDVQGQARDEDEESRSPRRAAPSDTTSLTSDYSTTSSMAPVMPTCTMVLDMPATTSSHCNSSEISPCEQTRRVTVIPTEAGSKDDDVNSTTSTSSLQETVSRIGRKIRFRAQNPPTRGKSNGTARRHTLTDIEAVRVALAEEGDGCADAGNAHSTGKSRMGRLTRWLKHSFRSSSPDVRGSQANGEGRNNREEEVVS